MDSNISEYSYNATSIDDYFTEKYNLEFNLQIVKELTEYSLSIIIKDKKLKFTENIHSNESQKKLKFTPLSFFNLFYHELEFIKSNKSKPLIIIPHLNDINLDTFESLYFFEKLSEILIEYQNDTSLSFIGKNIKTEYEVNWHKFFGDNLVKEIDLFSIEQKDLIFKKVKEFKTSAESLNFLIDLKHLLIEKELYSYNDKTFFNQVQSLIDYYKERNDLLNNGEKQIVPVFRPDYIELIYIDLASFFAPEQRRALRSLLETGFNPITKKLYFNFFGNRLAYTFRLLIENNLIVGCNKEELELWVSNNFQYRQNKKPTDYTADYLNDIISSRTINNKYSVLSSWYTDLFEKTKQNKTN